MLPRRLSYALVALILLLTACAPASETAPDAADRPADADPAPDADPDSDTGDAPSDDVPGEVSREWWKDLGVVLDPEEFGVGQAVPGEGFGVNDIKVAQRSDGTYVAVVASHAVGSPRASFHVIESTDLTEWTEIARHDMEAMLDIGFYIGTLIALPDGTLKMIGVSDRPGQAVSSSSTDGGRTWSADPGPLLTAGDIDGDVHLVSAAVVERPDGGWRMYLSANDCAVSSFDGGDNCPSDVALSTWDGGIESIFSAVSDDLTTWTVESGVRFAGSPEAGSMNHPTAWVDDDGRVRLTGSMKRPPRSAWPVEARDDLLIIGGGLMEVTSDDGLHFDPDTYREYRLPLSDVQVVRGPDGSPMMLAGAQGDRETDQRGQIRLLEAVTITWELAPAIPFPTVWQVPAAARLDEDPFMFCFRVEVRGSGRLQVDIRAAGWPWNPGSAPDELYEIADPVLDSPGEIFVKTRDTFDHPDVRWPTNVVVTDEDGVTWMVQPYGYHEHGFPGEAHGHDFASLPCPP